MYVKNSSEEAIIKILGKVTQDIPEFSDLQKQLELKKVLDEVLYGYEVLTKETGLVASDIEEKMRIYLATKRLDGMSAKTIKNYNYILIKFASAVRKPLSTISTMDLRMYLAMYQSNTGIKPGSVNAIIYALKSFFSWLVNEEYIIKNPMSKIKATKEPKRLRHAMSVEEIERLRLATKTDREKALIEFLISTGCRLSEVVGINKEDLNMYEMSLSVIGKGNKERKVYFSTSAKLLIKKYLETQKGESPALFTSGKYPYGRLGGRAIEREIKKIAERAGFDKSVYPHLFRHSYATHKLNSGMPLPVLQKLMGHESPDVTLIYAELSDDTVKHEYKKIS